MPLSISRTKEFTLLLIFLVLLPGAVVPEPWSSSGDCLALCDKYTKKDDLSDLIVNCKDLPDWSAREECMTDCEKCDKCQDGYYDCWNWKLPYFTQAGCPHLWTKYNYTTDWRNYVACKRLENDEDSRQDCNGLCGTCKDCDRGWYDCRALDPEKSQAACENLCAKYLHFSRSDHRVSCRNTTIADDAAREDCLGLCKNCEGCLNPDQYINWRWYVCKDEKIKLKEGGNFSQKGCEEVCAKYNHTDPEYPKSDRYIRCHNLTASEAPACWDQVCRKCGSCRIWGKIQYDCWGLIQPTPTGCKDVCKKYKGGHEVNCDSAACHTDCRRCQGCRNGYFDCWDLIEPTPKGCEELCAKYKQEKQFPGSTVQCESQTDSEACLKDCRKCGKCYNFNSQKVYDCEQRNGPSSPGGSHRNPGLDRGGSGESGLSGLEIFAIVVVVLLVAGGVGYGLYRCVRRNKGPQGPQQGYQVQPYYNPNHPMSIQSQGQAGYSSSASGATFSGGVTQPMYQPQMNPGQAVPPPPLPVAT